jgi:signal transduction histidine kinase
MSRVRTADWALAVAVGVVSGIGAWRTSSWQLPPARSTDAVGYVLAVAGAGALVVRRRWPLHVLAVATTATAGSLALSYPYGPPFLAMGIAMYFMAAGLSWRRSVVVCLVACSGLVGTIAVAAGGWLVPAVPVMVAGAVGWLVLPCAVGIVLKVARDELAQYRADLARRYANEERLRIARTIHDITGQWLAGINLHSAVALHFAERRPAQTREALTKIKHDSRKALEELRATLAMLAQHDEGSATRRPMPGLGDIDALISTMNDSGLRVNIVRNGRHCDLAAVVDLAAYRIVQQSLVDVLRHASSTTATVVIDYADDGVRIEITDDRQAADSDADSATIAGMRQRAVAIGGDLTAAARAGVGFEVRTRLPLRVRE